MSKDMPERFLKKMQLRKTTFMIKNKQLLQNTCLNVLGRAKRKMEELQRLLDTAKMNYQQLGGELEEDKIKQEERKESAR